jgi:hypothetical protein
MLMPAKSMEAVNHYQQQYDADRVASVRNRPHQSRRISAAELEQIMARQGAVDYQARLSIT